MIQITHWTVGFSMLFALCNLGGSLVVGQDRIDKETLAQRVKRAHLQYQQSLSGISGNWLTRTGDNHNLQRFDLLAGNVRIMGGATEKDQTAYREVQVYNRQYFFELSRSTAEKSWQLSQVNREIANTSKEEFYTFLINPLLLYSQAVVNIPLKELFAEPSFELKNLHRQGDRLVVEFSAEKLAVRPGIVSISGTIVLSDDQNMLVQSGDLSYQGTTRRFEQKLNVKYDRVGEIPVVAKAISDVRRENGPPLLIQHEISCRKEPPELADFTLTAFGFPEPPGTTVLQTPFPYWLVASIGGLALIGIAMYLRRRNAR